MMTSSDHHVGTSLPLTNWLPITAKELAKHGWQELDVIIVSGDAYVDHPAFGPAVIGRIIQSEGFRVGIIPQPNWQDDLRDFTKFGRPKFFFGVTSGSMDSMVNHYTAAKRRRSNDAYTPNGEHSFRPDYAATVYSRILKNIYPDVPVVLGGIEASLRRVTHYDYWSDSLFPTILKDSRADLLIYGMAERPLRQLLRLLARGVPFFSLETIQQTAILRRETPKVRKWKTKALHSHESCLKDKLKFAANFKQIEQESNKMNACRLSQKVGSQVLLINPPYPVMSEKEIDKSFDLPYTRLPHPKYRKRGPIPAYDMIRHSVTLHRGCFGGCSFCTISAHQGKFIASRSKKSILHEVDQITKMHDFKGYISDLGGPSANMYKMKGLDLEICEKCVSPSCIFPTICHNLDTSHQPLTDIYRSASNHPGVKKAFVTSGIRYDILVGKHTERKPHKSYKNYIEELVKHHVSGRLKVAPEHSSDDVLKVMRKPSFSLFYKFKKIFERINRENNLRQKLIPYFISSHPNSTEVSMANLACETKNAGFKLEQVQDFTPTPMTVATVIYYSGYHPYTLKPMYTARTNREKRNQHRYFFWYKKENRQWFSQQIKNTLPAELVKKLLSTRG